MPDFIRYLRTSDAERSVLYGDLVLDFFLSDRGFSTPLDAAAKAEILRPWVHLGENRRAMLSWIRQAPVDDHPKDVYGVMDAYEQWLKHTWIPKLLVTASNGFVTDDLLSTCREWPNQVEVALEGAHFLQMDAPVALGEAISTWYANLRGP
jgi:haloalkane dehalogenase